MKSLIILATLAFANGATVYPAGVDPNACPNYPFCGATAPADFPTPVVNGQPIAPILNTTPEQTAFWQKVTFSYNSHCLKITQNVAFEFLNFGIFNPFLSN